MKFSWQWVISSSHGIVNSSAQFVGTCPFQMDTLVCLMKGQVATKHKSWNAFRKLSESHKADLNLYLIAATAARTLLFLSAASCQDCWSHWASAHYRLNSSSLCAPTIEPIRLGQQLWPRPNSLELGSSVSSSNRAFSLHLYSLILLWCSLFLPLNLLSPRKGTIAWFESLVFSFLCRDSFLLKW